MAVGGLLLEGEAEEGAGDPLGLEAPGESPGVRRIPTHDPIHDPIHEITPAKRTPLFQNGREGGGIFPSATLPGPPLPGKNGMHIPLNGEGLGFGAGGEALSVNDNAPPHKRDLSSRRDGIGGIVVMQLL